MNWMKRIFSKKVETKQCAIDSVSNCFKIIHFPLTKRYYPKYKGWWLRKVYATGIIIKEDYFPVADGFRTEEQAREYISLFKEQWLSENIKTINV